MGDAASPATEPYESSLADLRASLKWLAASAGAVAAVLVAGLQLSDLGNLHFAWMVLAVVAAGVAIAAVLLFLFGATAVITTRGRTVTELSNAELGTAPTNGAQGSDDSDLRWLAQRRTLLLGTAESISALYVDGLVAAQNAIRDLRAGKQATLGGRPLDPTKTDDLAAAVAVRDEAEAGIRTVEAALLHRKTRDAFDSLMSNFKVGSWIFAVAVLAFAVAASVGTQADQVAITAPVPVTVYYSGTSHPCGNSRQGVALAGTWDAAVVALAPTATCPAERITATDGLVVVPAVTPK